MRVVLDVNIWISGLLWGGIPGRLLRLARHQQIILCSSESLLLELETTLKRPKFESRLQQRGYTVTYLMEVVAGLSVSFSTPSLNVPELRDPKDVKIIETALGANAEVIITGDLDLLILVEYAQIKIFNPTDFFTCYFPHCE